MRNGTWRPSRTISCTGSSSSSLVWDPHRLERLSSSRVVWRSGRISPTPIPWRARPRTTPLRMSCPPGTGAAWLVKVQPLDLSFLQEFLLPVCGCIRRLKGRGSSDFVASREGKVVAGIRRVKRLESIYIIALWLLGIVLVVIGWYIPGAGGFAWLGAATLIFGAVLAFRRGSPS